MVVLGIGTDICSVERMRYMEKKYGARFLDRVFTDEEQEKAIRKSGTAERLASRFAAKEATMKALGTGWGCGVTFLDIQISNEFGGRPVVNLVGNAAAWAEAMGVDRIHLSLSHERQQAVAFVVLEGTSNNNREANNTGPQQPPTTDGQE